MQTFKDDNRALSEMVRELLQLRAHNLQFKEGDPQDRILMFAEAALVCLVIEHFVRVVLGAAATNSDTLRKLLQKAVKKGLIQLPWQNQNEGIRRVCNVRDTLLHGNYAQAAQQAGCASVRDYFRTQFASEIATMEQVADSIVKQIDPATGMPRAG